MSETYSRRTVLGTVGIAAGLVPLAGCADGTAPLAFLSSGGAGPPGYIDPGEPISKTSCV